MSNNVWIIIGYIVKFNLRENLILVLDKFKGNKCIEVKLEYLVIFEELLGNDVFNFLLVLVDEFNF